jgi:hypothetical protein
MILFIAVFLYANPFKSKDISVSIFNSCAVDRLQGSLPSNGFFLARTSANLIAQGWVGDSNKTTKSDFLFVQLVNSKNDVIKTVKARSDFARPDVAIAYKNSAMEFTGFNFDLGKVDSPGDYTIVLGSINAGQQQVCTSPFRVKIS